jgi:hypothetical protein
MAGTRVDLQTATSSPTPSAQDPRFAVRIPGGARSGLLVVNVFAAPATTATLKIYSASDIELDPNTGASPSFWFSPGSVSLAAGTTGVQTAALTQVGEYVRWALEGGSGTPRFSVVLFLFDA